MTDPAGPQPPFPGFPAGFPGFPPPEMLDRMWGMMRMTPFGSAFPGSAPGAAGQGFGPSLSMMSDMMAPLTNIEELDKRITDLRAVEQWLKLNLSMLQSAVQALEVQRATLSTLRAFGAFAQSQMEPPKAAAGGGASGAARKPEGSAAEGAGDKAGGNASAGATLPPGFDSSAWWNLLQAQFNQLAQFAVAQPPGQANAAGAASPGAQASPESGAGAAKAGAAPRGARKGPSRPE